MNILDAYVKEYGYFNVVFTSVDYELLRKVIGNLAKDFKAEILNIYSIMVNIGTNYSLDEAK